jgi:hypothetical protein
MTVAWPKPLVIRPCTKRSRRCPKGYARYGVAHAWLIDPKTETLEAYELRGAEWSQLGVCGAADTPAAAPFPVAAFRVADLWR